MQAHLSRIFVVGAIAFVSLGPRADGEINIIFESFDNSTHPRILSGTATVNGVPLVEAPPSFDSDSSSLLNILQEIELEFQDAFEDSSTIRITYLWDPNTSDSSGNTLSGQSPPNLVVEDNNGNITHAVVRFRPDVFNWYLDPTPASDSEYTMDQVLYGFGDNSLASFEQTNLFRVLVPGDAVPAVFEAGYNGQAVPGGAADDNSNGAQLDLLTVAFQEVGHSLGMSSGYPGNIVTDVMGNPVSGAAADGLWQLDPDWVAGEQIATRILGMGSGPFAHFNSNDAVMGALNARERTRPSAADFMTIASIQGWAVLDLPRKDFLTGNDWTVPGNWMGNRVPDSADDVYIRHGGLVTLPEDELISNLVVDGGSHLAISNVSTLGVFNSTTVGGTVGDTSQITINAHSQLDSDILNINFDGRVRLNDDTSLLESERISVNSGGVLEGRGIIDLNDNLFGRLTLDDGTIRVTDGELQIQSPNALALDLQSGGVEVIDGDLRFSTGMFSPIGADITVGAGRQIAFDAVGLIGDDGLLNLVGQVGSPAESTGMQLFNAGLINANGLGIVENSLVLQPNGVISTQIFDPDSEIRLMETTIYQGGSILGPGTARQTGDATFSGDTLININTYDMDGQVGNTTLNIDPGVTVTINSPNIDTAADNAFDGTLNVEGGALHMEHDWRLDGVLNLTQNGPAAELVGPGRLTVSTDGAVNVSGAGRIDSPVTLQGSLFVASEADLNGDTIITATAELETNDPDDVIELNGTTVIGGGSYVGGGILRFGGDIQVIGDTSIGMGQSDLDGFGATETTINVATSVTLSVSSSTIDPTDDEFEDTLNIRGNFSTLVPFELGGTVNMIQDGGGAAPQLNGLTDFIINPNGLVNTDGNAVVNRDAIVQGTMNIGAGVTQLNGDATFESTAVVSIADGGELELNSPTILEGGSYTGDGLMQFNAATTITAATTINTARVDLDGAAENTTLTVSNVRLTLNVDGIDQSNNLYNGTMNVNSIGGRLDVNLSNPFSVWRLDSTGVLNFSQPTHLPVTMLAGNNLRADGTINATGVVRLAANVDLRGRLNSLSSTTDVQFAGGGRSLIHENAMATVAGLGAITVNNGSTLNLENGSLVAVDTENSGRLEVGFFTSEVVLDFNVPGAATIRGDFTQNASGEFAVNLGGLAQATGYDLLEVIGPASLDGIIEVTLVDGFVPQIGHTFQVMRATNVSGEFATIETIDEAGVIGFELSAVYSSTDVVLQVVDLFLLADFNGDGAVDGDDLKQWQGDFGRNGRSDADNDGDSDGHDFLAWQRQFGRGPQVTAASTLVPEPASIALLALAAVSLRTCKIGRQRKVPATRQRVTLVTNRPLLNRLVG